MSDNSPNSWIQFDFKDKRVALTGYSIKTCNMKSGQMHLRQWKIEGSNDLEKWVCIDEENTDVLNDRLVTQYFQCDSETRTLFRYIHITATGLNWQNNHRIVINELEFYGELFYCNTTTTHRFCAPTPQSTTQKNYSFGLTIPQGRQFPTSGFGSSRVKFVPPPPDAAFHC